MVAFLVGSFRPKVKGAPGSQLSPSPTSFVADLKEGFRWLWNHRLLRTLAIVLGLLNAAGGATTATMVLFAQEVLLLDATGFGLLASAGAVGGIIGSFSASAVTKSLGHGRSLAIAMAVLTATYIVIGLASSATLVWAMFAVQTFSVVIWNVITVSLRQTIIPDRLLGRVNSVYRFFGWGMMPIGIFLGGLLVEIVSRQADRDLGLRSPFLAAGIVTLAFMAFAIPRLTTAKIEAARAAAEGGPEKTD
jgi:MFS family permease